MEKRLWRSAYLIIWSKFKPPHLDIKHSRDLKRIQGGDCEGIQCFKSIEKHFEIPLAKSIKSNIFQHTRSSKTLVKSKMQTRIHIFEKVLEEKCRELLLRKSALGGSLIPILDGFSKHLIKFLNAKTCFYTHQQRKLEQRNVCLRQQAGKDYYQ